MFKRISCIILALAMIMAILVGCGNTSTSSGQPTGNGGDSQKTNTNGDEKVELDMVIHVQYNHMESLAKEFEALHPDIKVNVEVGQHADTGVYTAALAADACPDIVMLGSGASRIMPLAEAGLIEDLTDDYETRGWSKVVDPTIIDSIKRTSNGRIYEVSNGMDVFTIKYYKSEFDQLGLKPPTTYEEFQDLMKALKDAGKLPMSLGVKDGVMGGHILSAFLQAVAGRETVTDLLYGDTPFTDPLVVKAAEEVNNLMVNGYINKDCGALSYAEATAVFAAKNASTFLCLQGYLDQFVVDGLDLNDIGSFVIPSFDPSKPSLPIAGLAQDWVLPTKAKDKEAAYAWLDFVLSDDYIKALIKLEDEGSWNPGIGASIPQDSSILSQIKHPLVRAAFESLESGFGYNMSPYLAGNLKTTYFEVMQSMLTGQITPQQAMEQLQKAKESQ